MSSKKAITPIELPYYRVDFSYVGSGINSGANASIYKFSHEGREYVAKKNREMERHDSELSTMVRIKSNELEEDHIVHICGVTNVDINPAIVMKMYDLSLADYNLVSYEILMRSVRMIFHDCAIALLHLHEMSGICHIDLTPRNILLDLVDGDHYRAYLCDFGSALPIGESSTNRLMCTDTYVPPEVIMNGHYEVMPSHDVWSLGVVILYILSGDIYKQMSAEEHWNNMAEIIPSLSRAYNIKGLYSKKPESPYSGSGRRTLSTIVDDPILLSLLEQCLNPDYEKRPTPREILNHKYFSE